MMLQHHDGDYNWSDLNLILILYIVYKYTVTLAFLIHRGKKGLGNN